MERVLRISLLTLFLFIISACKEPAGSVTRNGNGGVSGTGGTATSNSGGSAPGAAGGSSSNNNATASPSLSFSLNSIPDQTATALSPFVYQLASTPVNDPSNSIYVGFSCASNCPSSMSVNAYGAGMVSWTPFSADSGEHDIVFKATYASNGTPLTDTKTMKLTVTSRFAWDDCYGTNLGETVNGIAVDGNQNVFVVGSTAGNLEGNTNLGGLDLFVTKISPSGQRLWTVQDGTVKDDVAYAVGIDSGGNVIVGGATGGNLDGIGSPSMPSGTNGFLSKYDPNGNRIWTVKIVSPNYAQVNHLITDQNNNIFVSGTTAAYLGFVGKFSSAGNNLWMYSMTVSVGSTNIVNNLVQDAQGNSYVVGTVNGSYDGQAQIGGSDYYVSKINPSGSRVWSKQFGSTAYDSGNWIAIDGVGDLIIVGNTNGNYAGTNAGQSDIFIHKIDQNGNTVWLKQYGGPYGDYSNQAVTDSKGNVALTAWVGSVLIGQQYPRGVVGNYISLLKVDSTGNLLNQEYVGQNISGLLNLNLAIDSLGNGYISTMVSSGFNGETLPGGANGSNVAVLKYSNQL